MMKKTRLHHLDGIRGIAALAVVVVHADWPNQFKQWGFASAGLWVDFFFVLSGFVIAYNYQQRLSDGFGLGNYMYRRMARIYPAHFVMLFLLLGLEILKYATEARSGIAIQHPAFSVNDAGSFFASLGLVQAMGIYETARWNGPSWSISAEAWTYLVFGIAFVRLQRPRAIIAVTLAIIALSYIAILLNPNSQYLSVEADFGFFRCLIGFGFGVLCFLGFTRAGSLNAGPLAKAAQWALMAAALAVVASHANNTSATLAAPLLFAALVYMLAVYRGGGVEMALMARPIQFLGTISYSLYISHVVVARVAAAAFKVLAGHLPDWLSPMVAGNLLTPFYAAVTIAFGWLVWRFIETPANAWFVARLAHHRERPAAVDPAF